MHKNKLSIIIVLILYLIICNRIYMINIKTNNVTIDKKVLINKPIEQPIGKLIIEKININNNLYPINSKHNNIEENITILKDSITPDKENSIVFIAAHSGDGKIAYFNKLDKIKINDKIILLYKNKKYIYTVINIWEKEKDGYIEVNKTKENQLILTTCSPNKENMQLIINSILKESIN